MADLVRTSYINDWDLEAIIRGWGGGSGGSTCSTAVEEVAVTWQPPVGLEFEGFDSVDRLEATATVLNELEELYKPFLLQQKHPKSCDSYSPEGPTSTKTTSSSPAIFDGCDDGVEKPEEQEVMRPEVVDDHTPTRASCKRSGRYMKRKQKTRVVHLGVGDDDENNLSKMDQWNWRKYGQKSIKGSPYPRSYYKCSSLGGCSARKQVEQSMEHPYTLVVTYIGDHVHPFPAKRRPLAGRTLTNSILPQPPLPT